MTPEKLGHPTSRPGSCLLIYDPLCTEYACCVYGPMMTATDVSEMERLQKRILKIIYGYNTSYRTALTLSGLDSLESRRADLFRKFAIKTAANPRFGSWFPAHKEYGYQIRKKKRYEEETAKTARLYRSPIFSMQRTLNVS